MLTQATYACQKCWSEAGHLWSKRPEFRYLMQHKWLEQRKLKKQLYKSGHCGSQCNASNVSSLNDVTSFSLATSHNVGRKVFHMKTIRSSLWDQVEVSNVHGMESDSQCGIICLRRMNDCNTFRIDRKSGGCQYGQVIKVWNSNSKWIYYRWDLHLLPFTFCFWSRSINLRGLYRYWELLWCRRC